MATKGDKIHMFEPYYSQYINCAEFSGAEVVTHPMWADDNQEWHFDFKHLEESLDATSKIIIITNPHNPTGRMWTQEELQRFSDIMDKFPQCTVLNDEVYFHLPFDGRKHLCFSNMSEKNWAKTLNVHSAGKMFNATGWKIGWTIGPKELVHQAFFVHEAACFNCNVPGQVAMGRVLERAFTQEYEGYPNYFAWTAAQFQAGRDEAVKLIETTTNIKFKASKIESGYFMPLDISGNEDKIPAKYFVLNGNYEEDPDTKVKSMKFGNEFDTVPLDFAVARYLAVEKGLSCMPITNFAPFESKHAKHNYIRLAICRPAAQFTDPVMQEKFKKM